MSKIPPTEFGAELVTLMREVLDEAVERIDAEHRTPATKAKMAERIVRTASNGVTAPDAVAVGRGRGGQGARGLDAGYPAHVHPTRNLKATSTGQHAEEDQQRRHLLLLRRQPVAGLLRSSFCLRRPGAPALRAARRRCPVHPVASARWPSSRSARGNSQEPAWTRRRLFQSGRSSKPGDRLPVRRRSRRCCKAAAFETQSSLLAFSGSNSSASRLGAFD